MSKKFTISDIARELNITPSTVSRALNDHPRISEETKQLVKAAAERGNYQVNGVASALRSGRTYTLGVIVPTADRSFFSSIVRGIEMEANLAGYNVMICQSNDNYEAELLDVKALLRAQVDGIALSISKQTVDVQHLKDLKKRGVPLVLFDRVIQNADISTVTINDYEAGYKATEHLIEQGCRRIATFASENLNLEIYRERLRGYKAALVAHQLPVNEAYIHLNNLRLEGGRAGAAALWALPEPPDAIFCASDYSALGAMQFLKEKGIKIPKEVALVGFANESFTAFIEPALTTVHQQPVEMGERIAQLFLEQMESTTEPFTAKNITLNAELIIRQSSLFGR
jgi:LacI family transcriptional regulator